MSHPQATLASDLFFDPLVRHHVVENPRFVRRDWLATKLDAKLRDAGTRFTLLTAEPGAGKSVFMAQLAHDHPEWLRYFIRFDQRMVLCDVTDKSLLLRIGYQLAALHPELFAPEALRLSVVQSIGEVTDGGTAIGAEVQRLVVSPFYQKVLEIEQRVRANAGRIVGLRVEELVVEPRLLSVEDLFHLAIVHPARALSRAAPGTPIVILVDALDEIRYHKTPDNILHWLTECPPLPENIRFVLASRPPDEALDFFCSKQAHQLTSLAIGEDDADVKRDVRLFVTRLLSEPELELELKTIEGGEEAFASAVTEKAHGNLGYVDALARAVDQARRVDRTALGALLGLNDLPSGLEELYTFFLHQIKMAVARDRVELRDPETGEPYDKPVWSAVYDRILGLLAVATEPLDLAQLKSLSGIRADVASISDAVDGLTQFLDVVEGRYRLYHASIVEFLTAQRTFDNTSTHDLFQDARERHRQVADVYWNNRENWDQCDDYGLRNLATHLYRSGQFDRLARLIGEPWMRARVAREGQRYSGFAVDVGIACQGAIEEGRRNSALELDPGFGVFAEVFRCSLILAKVNSFSSDYPPELVRRALEAGVWSLERALDVAARVPDPMARARSYAGVLASETVLSDRQRYDVCRAALSAVQAIDRTQRRARLFKFLAPRLDAGQLEAAVVAARNSADAEDRADALLAVARHLNGGAQALVTNEALSAARTIPNDGTRAEVLVELAPWLNAESRQDVLSEALEAGNASQDPKLRVRALSAVAYHLSDQARPTVLRTALDAAQDVVSQQERVEAFTTVAIQLDADAQMAVLARAFREAQVIADPKARAWALWDYMSVSGDPAVSIADDVLAAARAVLNPRDRVPILIALARRLSGAAKAAVLNEALLSVRTLQDDSDLHRFMIGLADRTAFLTSISGQLDGRAKRTVVAEALILAHATVDREPGAKALITLSARLNDDAKRTVVDAALAEAKKIADPLARGRTLARVASQLTGDAQALAVNGALTLAKSAHEEFVRSFVLFELVPQLHGDQLVEALSCARTLKDDLARTMLLTQLMKSLPAEMKNGIATEAIAGARSILDAEKRAVILGLLAIGLTDERRTVLLQEALTAARAIDSAERRTDVMMNILPELIGPARTSVEDEILATAQMTTDKATRVRMLAKLATKLDAERRTAVMNQAIATVQTIEDQRAVFQAMVALAMYFNELRGMMLDDLLSRAKSFVDMQARAEAFVALGPILTDDKQTAEALDAIGTIDDARLRLDALLALQDDVIPSARLKAIRRGALDFFYERATRLSRAEVLETIGSNMFQGLNLSPPVVTAIATHIIEIDGRWRWP